MKTGQKMFAVGLLAATAMLVASPAVAGEGEGKQRGQRDPAKRAEMREKMLEKFDTDGDGKLSKEERSAAREARGAEGRRPRGERGERGARGGRRGPGGPVGRMPEPAELFDRIDADGDGSVSKEQFVAFMTEMREKMRAEMESRRGNRGDRPRGSRGGRERGPQGGESDVPDSIE